jgi:hypothetical protein
MAQDLDEDEWSVLEYARYHRLCKQYDSEMEHYCNLPAPVHDNYDWYLEDSSDGSVANNVNALMKEPLAVSKEVAMLLRTTFHLREAPSDQPLAQDRHQWMRNLRQELPILQTDSELDLFRFGNAAIPDFGALNIPFEITHTERDEGLDWPTKYLTYPAECEQQTRSEKLAISREVLLFLRDTVTDLYTAEDSVKISEESLRYRKVSNITFLRTLLNI